MPEVGKDFSVMNGMNMGSGPSSAPAVPQGNPMERNNLGSGLLNSAQNLQANPPQLGQQQSQPGQPSQPSQLSNEVSDSKDKEVDEEQALGTAIFRPDADFREKLRLSQEAAERARLDPSGQHSVPISGAASWERRARDEDDEGKEEEPEVEEDESTVIGEGEGTKAWKAKRTLRKLVA